MTAFQRFQAEFAGHLRDPGTSPRPHGTSRRGMDVYAEIVFNNMESTLSACFPVCKKVIGVRRWKRLVRAFLAGHRCASPLFRQIPEEFLRWLETRASAAEDLPPFFGSLAHYEWVELAVAVAAVEAPPARLDGDLLAGRPVLAASLMLLEYPYPVHRISPRFKPALPDSEPTRLLVYRDTRDEVAFVEINAVTAILIRLLQAEAFSGHEALERVAQELQYPDPTVILGFGAMLLDDLRRQGVILGTAM